VGEKYMKLKLLFLAITAFLLVGCSNNQDVGTIADADSYEKVREVAWEFIEEKGWNDTAKEGWQSAKVKKIIADNRYELFFKRRIFHEEYIIQNNYSYIMDILFGSYFIQFPN